MADVIGKKPEGAKDKPIDHIRAGSVSASVWENEAKRKDGSVAKFLNITFQRSFRDEKELDENKNPIWKNTDSYGIGDLPKLFAVALAVYMKHAVVSDDDKK